MPSHVVALYARGVSSSFILLFIFHSISSVIGVIYYFSRGVQIQVANIGREERDGNLFYSIQSTPFSLAFPLRPQPTKTRDWCLFPQMNYHPRLQR